MRQKFQNLVLSLPILTALLFLLLATAFCANLMHGFQTFARGENLWSKSEKQMQLDLLQFTYSRDHSLLADAANHLAVLDGDRTARRQLDSGNPNYRIVTQGFLQGENAPEDIPSAIRDYRLFGHTQAMSRALKAWRDTDAGINELAALLSELTVLDSIEHSDERAAEIRSRLTSIDHELGKRQITFSETMNFESSRAESLLLITNVAAGALLMSVAGFISRRLTRRLRRSELRDLVLRKANEELEKRVLLRTAELEKEVEERKQTEVELQSKTAFLEAQGNATIDGILVVDSKGEKIFRNSQFLRLWKIPQHIADDKSDADQVQYVLSLTKEPGKFLERVRYLYDHPDLSSRDEIELRDGTVLDRYSAPVLGKDGQHYGRIWTFRDVTERRRSEDALHESEERFRLVVEDAPLGILIQSDEIFQYLNPAALAMFGAETADQIIGHSVAERIHPDSRAAVRERIRVLKEDSRTGPGLEEQLLRLDKMVFDVEVTAKPFVFEGQTGSIVFVRDITKHKREERALRESEERFRLVVEGAPEGICIQTDGLIRYLNSAALRMIGAENVEQIVGQSFLDRIHPDCRAAVIERAEIVKRERKAVPPREEKHLRLDGSSYDAEVSAVPFFFEGHDGAIVFFSDISERKREVEKKNVLEQQLRQAQKMEAVGRLAGGIAHDFNNLLMVIQTYTEMLQDSLPIHDSLRRNTEQVLKAAERGASLTGQMLAFSRKQIVAPTVLDLNAVIVDTAKMLKRLIGEDIEFQVDSAESLWPIKADPDQIVQVLMNLCVNSRDAMPRGGTLTIATGNVTLEEGWSSMHADVPIGDYVRLTVTDTGMGISEEFLEQIFEPFFTTKEVGKGTGLGLAMVYGIVKQSGGYVWGNSSLEKGTCFTIHLPKVPHALVSNVTAMPEAPPRGTETLLVVEDEEFIRDGICEFLRSLGYTVFAANSGHQALLVASEQERIDLLITDVVMPKMSGRELSQILGSLRPDLKTIHMSGYTDDAVLRHGIHELSATFLQKPFSLGTLACKVRDTLGRIAPRQ